MRREVEISGGGDCPPSSLRRTEDTSSELTLRLTKPAIALIQPSCKTFGPIPELSSSPPQQSRPSVYPSVRPSGSSSSETQSANRDDQNNRPVHRSVDGSTVALRKPCIRQTRRKPNIPTNLTYLVIAILNRGQFGKLFAPYPPAPPHPHKIH